MSREKVKLNCLRPYSKTNGKICRQCAKLQLMLKQEGIVGMTKQSLLPTIPDSQVQASNNKQGFRGKVIAISNTICMP